MEDVIVSNRTSNLPSDMLSVAGVLLNGSKKPANALLIIVVLLALKNDLLAAENKLVAATLGEVILCEYLAALVNLFACSLLVFLRNAVRQSILKSLQATFKARFLGICIGVWVGGLISYRIGFACNFLGTVPCLVRDMTCIKCLSFVLDLNSLNWIVANGATGSRNVELRDGRLVNANLFPSS
jgi:hypothetical protein